MGVSTLILAASALLAITSPAVEIETESKAFKNSAFEREALAFVLPFPSVMLLGAGAGGGGGGPVTQYETLGNVASVTGSGTSSANMRLVKITPTATGDITEIVIGLTNTTGQSAKALVYADNAGVPGAQIAVGAGQALGSVSVPTLFALPIGSTVTINSGTSYWIGYVPSGSVTDQDTSLAGYGTFAHVYSMTYASPDADLTGLGSTGANRPIAFVRRGLTGALVGTGIIATSQFVFHGNTTRPTWVDIPQFAVGDVIYIQIAPTNGGPPTLSTPPPGFTSIGSRTLNNSNFNGTNFIYRRIIDGTENGLVAFQCTSYSVLGAKLIVVRGVDVSGTPEESVVTSTGSGVTVTSAAITTLGANRLALNFFAAGAANGTDLTGAADAWTDYYDVSTTTGTDCALSCTERSAPTAGLLSTESRTNAAAGSTYGTVCFAVIML